VQAWPKLWYLQHGSTLTFLPAGGVCRVQQEVVMSSKGIRILCADDSGLQGTEGGDNLQVDMYTYAPGSRTLSGAILEREVPCVMYVTIGQSC
jgi:hypothetical protein